MTTDLNEIYQTLYDFFGPQHWWPGDSAFEIMVGAILTQNTNWLNVDKAITNLKNDNLLEPAAMGELAIDSLASLIRPAGYYNLKAKRLKSLLALLKEEEEEGRGVDDFLSQDIWALREKLLSVKGIGPETADSILLYAANKPVFVVDAYTHRILLRHDLICEDADYQEIQDLFMDSLAADSTLFNEYHALLVCLGKDFCKKTSPRCNDCPLQKYLPT